jgi:hypothetical protein
VPRAKLGMMPFTSVGRLLGDALRVCLLGARIVSGFRILLGLRGIVPGVLWWVQYAITDEVVALEPRRRRAMLLPSLLLGLAAPSEPSWLSDALLSCFADLMLRFSGVVMLLVYLGVAPVVVAPVQAQSDPPFVASPAALLDRDRDARPSA